MERLPGEIESAVLSFAEEKQSTSGQHPEIDDLVAYHEGRLDGGARETLREHLALCRECSAVLLDLADFHHLEPASEDHRLSEADEEALKGVLKERLREAAEPPAKIVPFEPRRLRTSWKLLAHAAVLLLALGGFWTLTSRPGSDVDVLYLRPDSARGSVAETFQVADWAKSYLLVLGSIRLEEATRFHLEILDDGGKIVVRGADLHKDRDGTLNFRVPRRRLAAGTYEIRLLGDGSDEPLETYRLEIEVSE